MPLLASRLIFALAMGVRAKSQNHPIRKHFEDRAEGY